MGRCGLVRWLQPRSVRLHELQPHGGGTPTKLRGFIMDNIDPLVFDPERSRIIQLNPSQYSFYQKTYIKILDPDGKCLESIGHSPQKSLNEENFCRLREQISLLFALFCNIDETIELPPMAIAGLAEVMLQMRKVCDGLGT